MLRLGIQRVRQRFAASSGVLWSSSSSSFFSSNKAPPYDGSFYNPEDDEYFNPKEDSKQQNVRRPIITDFDPVGVAEQRIILPSTEGLEDWRKQQYTNTDTNEDELSVTTDLYRPEIHLPSAPTDWSGYEASTPLSDEITALIGVTGRPISTAQYMRMALTHQRHGYYTRAQSVQKDDFDRDDYDDDNNNDKNKMDNKDDAGIIGADFITAPEVSQVFGEGLGIWFATEYQSNPTIRGRQWQFLECGPGRGSLMVDLLRFTRDLSQDKQKNSHVFGDNCRRIHFIERSPVLRQQQRENLVENFHNITFEFDDGTLAPSLEVVLENNIPDKQFPYSGTNIQHKKKPVISVHWHDTVTDFRKWQNNVPTTERLPTYVIGQEFLDALPVYAFEKTKHGYWRERMVDVALREDIEKDLAQDDEEEKAASNSSGSSSSRQPDQESTVPPAESLPADKEMNNSKKKPRLRIVLAPEVTPALKTLLQTDDEGYLKDDLAAPAGTVVEVCPEAILFVQDIAELLEKEGGGAALFVDYGSAGGSRDSLRGYSRHEQVHFLSRPGQVDVTADVDFLALVHAVNNRKPSPEQSQTLTRFLKAARAYGPTRQVDFLMAMGIRERVIDLIQRDSVSDDQAENLFQALVRLASPEEMGTRYKVLAISTREKEPPAFENLA